MYLEGFDVGVSVLEILVQAVSLGDELWHEADKRVDLVTNHMTRTYMLLPLPEPAFFQLDLFGEPLAQKLFFLLEFRVVKLLDLGFAKLPGFHLSLSVRLVVGLFGRGDQVEHVDSQKQGSKFAEVAVVLVVD